MDSRTELKKHRLEDSFFFEENQRKSPEDEYIRQEEIRRAEKRQKDLEIASIKSELTKLCGITNPEVSQRLAEFHIRPNEIENLVMEPLKLIAWADGQIDEEESKAVLRATACLKGSREPPLSDHAIVRLRDEQPSPKMFAAWKLYLRSLSETLTRAEFAKLHANIISAARYIAKSSGGFIGLGRRVSLEEKNALNTLESHFEFVQYAKER